MESRTHFSTSVPVDARNAARGRNNPNVASTFGWLDADTEQRRRMLEVVDLFKEEGTVDELGIGSIRDAISEGLFPGTSVLHTRLRYVLFIPWLLQRAALKPTPSDMSAEFRHLEYRLIGSLLAGGERLGVMGNTAGNSLKRLPSSVYWSALGAWGIRKADISPDGYFRRQYDHRQLVGRLASSDDPEARDLLPGSGLDPHLPEAPGDLLNAADFNLTSEEEQYLSDAIARSSAGSLLAWLVLHPPANSPDHVWDIDNLDVAPVQLAELVDHARRFHTAIYGAAVLYNLLLARKSGHDDAVGVYEERLDQWRLEVQHTKTLDGWSRSDWWGTVRRLNPRVRPITVQFVDRWLNLIEADTDMATSRAAHDLITSRERQIKGGRARLVNQSALDRWSGESGMGRLDYRWTIGWRHLSDLYAARGTS